MVQWRSGPPAPAGQWTSRSCWPGPMPTQRRPRRPRMPWRWWSRTVVLRAALRRASPTRRRRPHRRFSTRSSVGWRPPSAGPATPGRCCRASPPTRWPAPISGRARDCGCDTTSRKDRWSSSPAAPTANARPGPGQGRRGPSTSTWRPSKSACAVVSSGRNASIELPAGRYEVLLPPDATADLMVAMSQELSGRDAEDGRNAFSATGGATKVGDVLSEVPFVLRSDPAEPGLESAPFVVTMASSTDVSVFDNGLASPGHHLGRRRASRAVALPPGRRGPVRCGGDAAGRQPRPRTARCDRRLWSR